MKFPEQYRWRDIHVKHLRSKKDDRFGVFRIPGGDANGRHLLVLATDGTTGNLPGDGTGWEHASVSIPSPKSKIAMPSWPEMCIVKDLFWEPTECVVQFHVPAEDHVNLHDGCLHLFRYTLGEFPRPSKGFV